MPPLQRPPGPPSRGLHGNFPLATADPLGLFTEWARVYGDIYHYRFLHRHVYVLSHPDPIKEVLLTNSRNFIKGEAIRNSRRIFGKGLVSNEGAPWLQQRRLIQPAFHRDRIAACASMMVAATERMMANWREGEVRDIHGEMMRVALEMVAKALFNVEIAEGDRFYCALNAIMDLSSGPRMLLPPIFRRLPLPDNLRYERAARDLDAIVYALIRERRAAGRSASEDLLDTLLEARDEDGAAMPDEQVRDEVMTLLLAGHETTAVSLTWTWLLLAQHPEVEESLCAELRRVLNGRAPTMNDLPALPLTERIIKESMRLYPPLWALVRNPLEDCEIGGYRVPAESAIMMSQWVVHRDARFFDEPERFNPDRWLDERSKALPKFAYFPFGGGPRNCIGASFAMMEAMLVLATVAQRYQVRVAQAAAPKPLPAITLRPRHGLKVVLHRRN